MRNSRDIAVQVGATDPHPSIRTGSRSEEVRSVKKVTIKKMVEVEEVVEMPAFLEKRIFSIVLDPKKLIGGDDFECILIDIFGSTNDHWLPASEARAALERAMAFFPRKDNEKHVVKPPKTSPPQDRFDSYEDDEDYAEGGC